MIRQHIDCVRPATVADDVKKCPRLRYRDVWR
jgi:hypothetical protein